MWGNQLIDMGGNMCCGMVAAMSYIVLQNATYEDLMKVPEHRVAEIVDGTLYSMPRPSSRHARTSSMLGGHLVGPFDLGSGGPGGWIILDEPELHLGKDIVVPDLAGWRTERMPTVPDVVFFELAPDWVCEVLSPSTHNIDRSRKMDIYAREAVDYLWLVDPIVRILEVYRIHAGQWMRMKAFTESEVVRAQPFDAIEIHLVRLWLDPQP